MSTRESTDWAEIDRLRAEVERLADELQTETEASAAIESMYRTQQTVNDRLRAELETLKRERDQAERLAVSRLEFANESFRKSAEYAVKLDMLTHEHKLTTAERDRHRAALQEIVDRATIETAPAANIARKALEGDET